MKLTDTQAILLAAAANRDDGLVPLTERLRGSAAGKVARSLIEHGLAAEVTVTRNDPFWREDEDGSAIALRVTCAGLEAVGIVDEDTVSAAAVPDGGFHGAGAMSSPPAPRPGTRRELVIRRLGGEQGTSIAELAEMTGWQPHTLRAALTRLRQAGYAIDRLPAEGGMPSRYRLRHGEAPAAEVAHG